jgi:hypothetical protein
MRLSNSLLISLLGLVSLTLIGLVKGLDVSMAISGICLAYVSSRSAQKIGIGMAVSRDANANSENIIDKIKD